MPSPLRRRVIAVATTGAAVCALAVAPTAAGAAVVPAPISYSAEGAALSLAPLETFETGVFDESAAEIVEPYGDRLFVVNAKAGAVDVLDWSDPGAISKAYSFSSEGTANSVAIREDGLGVIAFQATEKTDPGRLVFFDANAADPTAAQLGSVTVGALPDMVTISKDGRYAVVANEGEPADDFSVDPEGSIGVVTLPAGIAAPAQDAVRIAGFAAFEDGGSKTLADDVRVFGPTPSGDDKPVSRNLEPEYITIDGGTAYASLQEANAIAVVDLAAASVTDILPLGFKDHGLAENALDPSDRDGKISLRSFDGLKGMYMPDGVQSYTAGGQTYLVTANEGDAREWGDYVEVTRAKDIADNGYGPVCASSPLAGKLGNSDLGRLNVSIEGGFDAEAGCYQELYSFGARSFSIWSADGEQVFDSGSAFEEITAAAVPEFFNSNHSASNLEGRSDDKGPEPENVTIGELSGRTYAFIGFERIGGIMVYDITDPTAPTFVTYANNRDFSQSVEDGGDLSRAGDLGPEGIVFVPAEDSPTGTPVVVTGNEVSGTTTVFEITDLLAPETTDIRVLTMNDFHGRLEQNLRNGEAGAAVLAGAVDQFEAQNPNTVLVAAGDSINASTFTSFIQKEEPTIDALVAAGLDVAAVGNHEFDMGFDDLTDRVLPRYGDARYGLGANVYDAATGEPALQEYEIQEIDGVRVAFIGTVTEQTPSAVAPAGIEGLEFGDPLEAANRVAAELTAGDLADVIVLLTHEGSAKPDCASVATDPSKAGELIRGASPEIDAIVSGHTQQKYACDVPVDGTDTLRPVVQAHQYGTTLGSLEMSVDADTKELLSIEGSVIPLVVDRVAQFPAAPDVQAIVDEAVKAAEVEGAVEVGSITADITRAFTPDGTEDRGSESSLSNLLADVYLWATSNEDYAGTPAQIGLMNPGGVRDDLRYGEDGTLSYREVANVQPFANTLVTVTLTGAQLKSVLEEQWQPAGESRPKLQLGVSDGFSYEYDETAPRGERIVSMSLDGVGISEQETFTVVTNSFLAGGGDSFFTFAEGTDRTDTGQADLAATVAYFEQFSPVEPAELGRAQVAGGENPGTPGTDWAKVDVGTGSVERGGTLAVKVSGLRPGQQIGATLYSDPIVVRDIPAAGADGTVAFEISIPSTLALGEHRLVITSEGLEPIEVGVKVVSAGALAVTGSELPMGLALGAVLLLLAGATLFALRRRAAARG